MEDFAYLATNSATAWLHGRGDGRFKMYERFYRGELARRRDTFDLDGINEEYARLIAETNPPQNQQLLTIVSRFAFLLVGLYAIHLALDFTKTAGHTAMLGMGVGVLVILRYARAKAKKSLPPKR